MKRIYLLTLLVAGALSASAQRNPNLSLRQLWAKAPSTNYAILKDGDKMLWDGGEDSQTPGTNKYNMGWQIINHGLTAMDTVQQADTFRIRAPWQSTVYRGNITGGLGQHDSTTLTPTANGFAFVPASGATSGSGTVNWCDSVWIEAGPGSTNLPVADPDPSNNRKCSQITVERWVTGIADISIEGSGIIIFPNPTTGKLNFKYKFSGADAKVTIVNLLGNVVYSKELNGMSGVQDVPVEVSHLSQGFYILQVASNGNTSSERFSIR